MRCRTARRVMTARLDGELRAAETQALEAHLAICDPCRVEEAGVRRLHTAYATLPSRTEVPAGLEQAALRRVRAALAEADDARKRLWAWWWVPLPVAAGLALVVALRGGTPPAPGESATNVPAPAETVIARAPAAAPAAATHVGKVGRNGSAGAARTTGAGSADRAAAVEPPPQVAAAPDLFLDLPILENLEKLQNFESIRTVDTDRDDRGGRG